MTADGATAPAPDPLEMAANCVRHVLACAEAQETDPVRAHVAGLGARGQQSAELGAHMAAISMAADQRRIAAALERIAAALEERL